MYKKIRQGLLTKYSDGRLDVNDLLRVIGSQSESTSKNVTLNKDDSLHVTGDVQLKQEIEQLKQLLAMKEIFINQLHQQIADLRQDKEQLFDILPVL